MVNDRRYKRHFIILENEDSGFGKTDKRMPKGYAKIEVRNGKGLLNVYVQDLKYFKDAKYIYRNYLISTKGKKGLYVNTGTFIIDEKGKAELKVKFNPDDVEGSGKPIEDFNIVAVIAQPIKRSSGEKEIYGPLVGYMDKQKVSWKDILAYEENTIKEDTGLDKEYKEKYEEIINVIEKSSKELYKEDKDKTKDYKKEEKEAEKTEDNEEAEKESKNEYKGYKEYDKDHYEDEDECVDSLEENDNGVKKSKNEDNTDKVEQQAKPQKKEKVEAKTKTEKKEEVKPEKKEEAKPVKKEEAKPEKKEEAKPEKKEEAKPEKKEEVKPKKKEEAKPEKKEEAKPEKKEEAKPEKKEEVKPEKKEEAKPVKKEEAKTEKKEEVKAEDKKEKNTKSKQSKTKYYGGKKTEIHYKKYHKMVYKYIKDMLKYYEKMQPFEKNIDDYKWWKMNYDKKTMHRGFLPFFGYVLSIYSYNPYIYYMNNCQNQMNMYGHYVFGIAYDKDMEPKYYVYGVPGRYLYKDQPFQGMTGFVYWHPLEDKDPEKGDYGYWLLHIDAMTGNVIFPMKPTIPPMY